MSDYTLTPPIPAPLAGGLPAYLAIHSTCYMSAAGAGGWTACDVTRLALCAYLVLAGVRRACRVPWPATSPLAAGAADALRAAGLEVGLRVRGCVSVAAAAHGGLGAAYAEPAPDGGPLGRVTWMCGFGTSATLDLWSEPLGADADLDRIVAVDLPALQGALRPLGYTAQARVE
jgi:hypothetical protein